MPVAGRGEGTYDSLIGCFVNMAPLRISFNPGMCFREAVKKNKRELLTVLEHSRYPFSRIVEQIQPERDSSRSPIFQTTFNVFRPPVSSPLRNLDLPAGDGGERPGFCDSEMVAYPLPQQEGLFDLSIQFAELRDTLLGQLSYSTDLFRSETAQRLLQQYMAILEYAVRNPDESLKELISATEPDREEIEI
jgi:non-ribosomal peptide synthetase component F